MDFFHRAIEIDPAVPASYERIADIHYSVYGRLDQAIAWQFEAIARDPNELMGPVYLILMYLSLGAVDEAEQWVDRVVRKAPPGFPFIERLYEPVYLRRGEVEASLEIARQAIQFDPQGRYTLMNLRDDDLRAGRYLDARARYARAVPELLEDDVPAVDHRNLELAIDLALVLQNTGEEERANLLLQGSLEVMQTMHRLGGGYGISDVMTHALLGHTDQALLALRSAIDAGWRENWWIYLEHDENLSSIRGRPEFQAIVEEVKADMATQLARVRELQAGGTLPEISDF
jgi:tetratricopeptide (TPR) repeat protein